MSKTDNFQPFTFAVDLDQTGFSYEDGIKREILSNNPELTEDDFPEMVNYDFVKSSWPTLKTFEDYCIVHQNAVEKGMLKDLEPYVGFSEGMSKLKDNGVYLKIVTHRLFPKSKSYYNHVADTVESLDKHNIVFDELCFSERKHEIICDAIVEDSPKNIDLWKKYRNDNVFIFDHLYNRHCEGIRVYNWEELTEKILELKENLGK